LDDDLAELVRIITGMLRGGFTKVMFPNIISCSVGAAILKAELLKAYKKWGSYI
jgi:hypothetical protein